MAIIWMDSFDNYGTGTDATPTPTGVVGRRYSVIGEETRMDTKPGRLGGNALQLEFDNTCFLSPGGLTINATMILGVAIRFDAFPGSSQQFIAFYDLTTLGMNLRIKSDGEIEVRRGTTVLETTTSAGLTTGAWYHIEFKVVCANSPSGSYEVRVGGVNVASDTGLDTQAGSNAFHTTFRLTGTSVSDTSAVQFDDLYVCDGSGSVNNDFLGNMRVVTIRPNAVGDDSDWTPTAGDNYENVDESVADDDSTYVESDTPGDTDLYDFEDPSSFVTEIKGVMIVTDCRNTDALDFDIHLVAKSGSTQSDGTAQAVGSTDYVTRTRILEDNPDTTDPWEPVELAAAQFGVKVG